jgi:hypothetical protein
MGSSAIGLPFFIFPTLFSFSFLVYLIILPYLCRQGNHFGAKKSAVTAF